MSTLVLELRQGDMMVVNGAPIRFRNRTRIELAAKARFLFGKQILAPEAADTPARRIYFALQTAYIGADDERPLREPGGDHRVRLRDRIHEACAPGEQIVGGRVGHPE